MQYNLKCITVQIRILLIINRKRKFDFDIGILPCWLKSNGFDTAFDNFPQAKSMFSDLFKKKCWKWKRILTMLKRIYDWIQNVFWAFVDIMFLTESKSKISIMIFALTIKSSQLEKDKMSSCIYTFETRPCIMVEWVITIMVKFSNENHMIK